MFDCFHASIVDSLIREKPTIPYFSWDSPNEFPIIVAILAVGSIRISFYELTEKKKLINVVLANTLLLG